MSIFELIGFEYFHFSESTGYNFVIIALFAIVTGYLKKVDFRMQRGTFFLNSACVVFGVSIGQCIWFLQADSIVGGYTLAIVLIDISIWALTAYALVVIGKARSNDAYGNPHYAALAFIPIASLWLAFTPSKDNNTYKTPSLLNGGSAVFIGLIVLLVGRGIGLSTERSIEDYLTNNTDNGSQIIIGQKFLEFYAKTDGLERALEYYKSFEEVTVGEPIDEVTMFESLENSEDTLTYKFLISDKSITGYTQEQREIWQSYICNNMSPILDYGATIVWHYYSDSVPMLAYVSANKEVCNI